MKLFRRDHLKILIVILLAGGLIYAFYNVVNSRMQGSENMRRIEEITGPILKAVNESDRLECKSSIYIQTKEERKHDPSGDINFVHDFKNQRLQIEKGKAKEIFEYKDEKLLIYSKGISPVYSKTDVVLKRIPTDKWFRYAAEDMYGVQRRRGESDQISYGYLKDEAFLVKVRKQGREDIGEKKYSKYRVIIRNTLKDEETGEESDNEFRKTLSANGLNVMDLKRGYPDVYKMLKDTYNKGTEELFVWVDEDGNMARIEKDYTFAYYLNIMKENSEKIEEKVGQYGYPRVICQQNYTYSPTCKNIEMPRAFEEL